jgi:hypothetical protein
MNHPKTFSLSQRNTGSKSSPLHTPGQNSASTPKSLLPVLLLAGIFVVANLLLLYSVRSKQLEVLHLNEELLHSQTAFEKAQQLQKTGMLAASMLNELEGWSRVPPLPIQLLEWFSVPPQELTLKSFHLKRPHLLRPLPEDTHQTSFKESLAVKGYAMVELEDSGEGKGKYELPRFFDETNAKFKPRFTIETPPEKAAAATEGISLRTTRSQWLLKTSFDLERIWINSHAQEISFHE